MAEIVISDMSNGYAYVIEYVLEHGRKVAPRGMPTLEVPDAVIVLEDPGKSLPIGINRKLNTKFAAVEAIQILGGFSDPQMLLAVNPRVQDFINGGVLHGAYGPRLRAQLPAVYDRLNRDNDTRQAVAMIWDPARDLFQEGIKDLPCTMMLAFAIRDRKLELHTTMRSNDVWWGLAYDVFCFTQLQIAMAGALCIDVGAYFHHAVSLHAYERDFASFDQLTMYNQSLHQYSAGLGWGDTWVNVRDWIVDFAYGSERGMNRLEESEQWYAKRLPAYSS